MKKFETVEEIEQWFKDWKYDEEVHDAIDFLVEKIKKYSE
jgi:hypothetical protein